MIRSKCDPDRRQTTPPARVFAYRPKDKGEWAKRTERKVKRQRKNAEKADD